MPVPVLGKTLKKVFGTRNERMVKHYLKVVETVNAHESSVRTLTDAELKAKTTKFRQRIESGEQAEDLIPEVFAVAREAMDRNVGIRNILNPKLGFDPNLLPADARADYDAVMAEIERADLAQPTGELLGNEQPVHPWQFVDIPVRLHEAVRELHPRSRPPFRARPFDVQLIGAIVLYEGRIAEMKTGEGKTIVAPLASYLAAIEGKSVHVVTVNDYLVQRDRDWVFPFFRSLGLTVGAIHPMHMQDRSLKQAAYACDVVYGTTSEFGFDYLRDNMQLRVQDQVQSKRDFAIVDEVDSTLIDEARTPLIISGAARRDQPRYDLADGLARQLVDRQKQWNDANERVQSCLVKISSIEGDIRNAREKDKVPALREQLEQARAKLPELEAERDRFTQFYEVEIDKKRATITHEGIDEAQRIAGIGSFYVGQNIDVPHLLENAIRAHTVYQRDRDYVVAPDDKGELGVVIVDQNTGRKMVGRQWSDGLHQAVEAKEKVPIKAETQTMATITIQNFFKLYDRLAGMTGTADTEATEFYEIYKLDVIVIPTNVPVQRLDREDSVYTGVQDKWDAIVDEIRQYHDLGQPVLVGTTSVEKSEMLSEMLRRRHQIDHEVLNAKQHEREADIIQKAGELGAVMIATNMAGRGTDIKLGRITPAALIDHWKRRGICPREVNESMSEDEILAAIWKHLARSIGLRTAEFEAMAIEEIHLALLRHWYEEHVIYGSDPESLDRVKLEHGLDESGAFRLHRLRLYESIDEMGGLHVIGTERHESRRIDNQLRGRSGRQGDHGSSRFFLSLEDDLMKTFAGPTTLKILSRLGMKEGDKIEHPMLSRAVGKAQRKVEERNFLIRKQILDYDEVMDHQRHDFYGLRQQVLVGQDVKPIVFEFIDDAASDAVARFLDRSYVATCISEWVHEHLGVSIDAERIRGKTDDRDELHRFLAINAKEEAGSMIRITLGEYMPDDTDPSEWDRTALVDWANATFDADLKVSEILDDGPNDVIPRIEAAADRKIDQVELDPLDQYLVTNYGAKELARWATNKLGVEVSHEPFVDVEDGIEGATEEMLRIVRETYARRELHYPIEYMMEVTQVLLNVNAEQALSQFCGWARAKYELDWQPRSLPSNEPAKLQELLIEEARTWDEAKIRDRAQRIVDRAGGSSATPDSIDEVLREELRMTITEEQRPRASEHPVDFVAERIAWFHRAELTQLERSVLLRILDGSWNDHLYEMDRLRESIGLRSFSQRDPRIEFKREGARLFEEMRSGIRDKVTDIIFKGRLALPIPPEAQKAAAERQAAQEKQREEEAADPVAQAVAAAAAAASTGSDDQQRAIDAANRAGAPAAEEEAPRQGGSAARRRRESKGSTKTEGVKKNFKRRRK